MSPAKSASAQTLSLFADSVPGESSAVSAERARIRAFLTEAERSGLFAPACDSWLSGHSAEFSAALGAGGWIGMTWPREYGGGEHSVQARFAVVEELLAVGAPVAAHWFADRQIGPSLLRHGTSGQRRRFLPDMAAGRLHFCVGMSESESGSDLGSVRTKATKVPGGWRVSGSKIWTSHAQRSHFMLALVRTGAVGDRPADALTQLIIDLATPGITVRPIRLLDGHEHFCEVFFDEVWVPDELVLGVPGAGWGQVLSELSYERSGPERFLSTFPLLSRVVSDPDLDPAATPVMGRMISRMLVLRAMSARVNAQLAQGHAPGAAAALVKDLGTRFEQQSVETVREWLSPTGQCDPVVRELFDRAIDHSPGFSLRGGTNEVLRGIVGKALGL